MKRRARRRLGRLRDSSAIFDRLVTGAGLGREPVFQKVPPLLAV